ncbi:MAG TPA: nucleotidyltransferase domain-containing protein [Thermoanaerobaculia bacterium]|nr:nucleotidyltransferase domain-containing protein [Thermoanaerobaculia bacterium]
MNSTAPNLILEQLLGSRLRAKALSWLLSHPGERFFVRQLAASLGEDSTNLSRELARLEGMGIVTGVREGHQKYFQADPESSIYPELRGLVAKTSGVSDLLREVLRPLSPRIEVAFVFGSIAAGKETAASDVDVLVIGSAHLKDLVEAFGPVQERLGREVNPTIYPVPEFREKITRGHHFLKGVLQGPKIFLIGSSRELERLVEVRLAD